MIGCYSGAKPLFVLAKGKHHGKSKPSNPIRQRTQNIIDRRFYRRKYDAAQALQQFATTARDEVDLDQLVDELMHVVQETVQPSHSALWLKPGQNLKGQRPDQR
jgi:hypothetical protein